MTSTEYSRMTSARRFCEAIISRFYTWHRSDGGGTGPSAEAGFRGRVDEIGIVVGGIPKWRVVVCAQSLCQWEKMSKGWGHISSATGYDSLNAGCHPINQSISSRRPDPGHARTWHGDVMMVYTSKISLKIANYQIAWFKLYTTTRKKANKSDPYLLKHF